MTLSTSLCGSHVSYEFADGTQIFSDLTFSFGPKAYGLVGINGAGKTTLLKLLSGENQPTQGSILRSGSVYVLPQDLESMDGIDPERQKIAVVRDLLGQKDVFEALERVQSGEFSNEDLDKIEGQWDLQERVQTIFKSLGLDRLSQSLPLGQLSGGEKVKVRLAALLLKSPSIVLLDEPTNNLDQEGRKVLEEFIESWKGCLIVASHDRSLLSRVQSIVELSHLGIKSYGGNYQFYEETRKAEDQSLKEKLICAEQALKKERGDLQLSLERQQKRMSRGRKLAVEGGIPPILAGGMKRKAQKTLARVKEVHQDRLWIAQQEVQRTKALVKVGNQIKIDLPQTYLPDRKEVLEFKNFNFRYFSQSEFLLKRPLTFSWVGPQRVSLEGRNGAGKSTLFKLLLGALDETSEIPQGEKMGSWVLKTQRVAVLDQKTAILGDPSRTLLESFSDWTPHLNESERRIRLGRFHFEQQVTGKRVGMLSGGERMRAALACALFSEKAPELLLLDEPTNNLDTDSVEKLESALSCFGGALFVISHDSVFLERIGIQSWINLDESLS